MNPNLLAAFAKMAVPGRGAAPMLGQPPASASMPQGMPPQGMPQRPPPQVAPRGMPPIDPSRVIRPLGNRPIQAAAAAGRGGDKIMAHMTPGEIAVPPEVQTPEVVAVLDRAFAQMGVNPRGFQAGNPDQKINPETGAPEFGFFDLDNLLPIALAIGGSMLLGPEVAPFLMEAGLGAEAAGIAGGAIGSGLGTTAGSLIGGKDIGESLGRGAIGAVGSGIGGAIGNAFGSGASAAEPMRTLASDAIRNPAGMADLPGGGLSPTGWPLSSDAGIADAAAAAKPSIFSNLISKQGIGSGLGGAIGGAVADDLFAKRPVKIGNGPSLLAAKPLSTYVGSGYGTPVFPDDDYLKGYGRRKEWNYYPT